MVIWTVVSRYINHDRDYSVFYSGTSTEMDMFDYTQPSLHAVWWVPEVDSNGNPTGCSDYRTQNSDPTADSESNYVKNGGRVTYDDTGVATHDIRLPAVLPFVNGTSIYHACVQTGDARLSTLEQILC